MPDPVSQQQAREELDSLLTNSIRRYEDILTLFAAINSERGDNNPEILHARGMAIVQLQEQAALADQALITTMQEMNPALLLDHPLLSRRQDIMRQILDHNRSLLSTTNNIKSLLAHELKQIQGGRAALNGYHCQINPSQNGGILNDAH
jgi:hypothetical protein